LGFGIWDLGFEVWDVGFGVLVFSFWLLAFDLNGVEGSGFKVQGLNFGV
jgi:hypothetical protein